MLFAFVPCTLTKGFFESELYVVVGASSTIADRKVLRVRDEPRSGFDGRGLVQVVVLNKESERALIELPGEPVVGSLRTWIPVSELQEAA